MTSPGSVVRAALVVFLPLAVQAQSVVLEGLVTMVWIDPTTGPPPPPVYYLHTGEADYQLVWPAGRPPTGVQVAPGTRWRIAGTGQPPALAAGDGRPQAQLRVAGVTPLGGGSLVGDASTLRYLTIVCESPGGPPLNYSPADAAARWGKSYPAVGHIMDELSEGQLDFQSLGGVGPAPMPQGPGFYGTFPTVNTSAIAQHCVDGVPGLSLAGVDGLNFVTNLSPGAAFGGTAFVTVAGVGRSIRATWIPQNQSGFGTIAHEVGHSIGWSHSGTDYSGDQGEPYGSHWDVMSAADWGLSRPTDFGTVVVPRQTIAANRMASGWIPADRHQLIEPGTSSEVEFEIIGSGREGGRAPGSRDLVEVVTPGGARYTLEARLKRGLYDAALLGDGLVMHRLTRPIGLDLGCCLAKLVDADGNGNVVDEGVIWTPGEAYSGGSLGFGFEVLDAVPNGFRVRVRSGFELRLGIEGQGQVVGLPGGTCTADCAELSATAAPPLVLTAEATDPDFPFRGWLGDCAGAAACAAPRDRDASVRAWFGREPRFLADSSRPHGAIGVAYEDQLSASVLGAPQFSVMAGSLPPGVSLNPATGALTGVPTTAGTFRFTASVNDGGSIAQRAFVMRVHAPLVVGPGDSVGVVRFVHTALPLAQGDGRPVALTLVSGAWPTGLAPDAFGELAGVATGSGTTSATFDVVRGNESTRRTLHFRMLNQAPVIEDTRVTDTFVGHLYNYPLRIAGSEPAGWRVASGELPPGITLGADGRLSGRAGTPGTYRFAIEARLASLTDQREFEMIVAVPALQRSEVMNALLRATSLGEVQRSYLDYIGNRNSRFDLGDVRAWLLSTGAIPAPGASP